MNPLPSFDATIFAISPDPIVIANRDGMLRNANPAAERLTGYSRDELLARPYSTFIHPADQGELARAVGQVLEGQIVREVQLRLLTRSGGSLWLEWTASPLADGSGLLAIGRDITARLGLFRDVIETRRAEELIHRRNEELEAMFASTHVHIAILNRQFDFLRVNVAYAAANGKSVESFQGKNHFALFPHAENERIFREVVESGVPFVATAKPFQFPDNPERGTTYWDFSLYPLRSAGGEIEGLVLTLVDVTLRERQRQAAEWAWVIARTELEQKVRERTLELEIANSELESFSYSVSHDLRAPLRAINGYSQALREEMSDRLSDEANFFLERIRASTLRMGQLIEGLLKLSQVSRHTLNIAEINLSAMAAEALAPLREGSPERRVEVHIEPEMRALGDITLLRVLLENLFSNAWKFTIHNPQPLIEFGSVVRDRVETYFVRDNGVGFDNKYADKLFRPFERLHSPREFEGTGIGLATVSRIIKRHGGRIWAEGRNGEGATIFFTLRPDARHVGWTDKGSPTSSPNT